MLVAFEADAGGSAPASCLIAADRLDIVEETVLRYWREDTVADQRFAPWVRFPGQRQCPGQAAADPNSSGIVGKASASS